MFKKMIIAEIGSVHDGSFGNAIKLIEVASQCGANAIKFQTHISHAETTKNAPSPSYFNQETRYEYFNRTSFTKDQWIKIKEKCHEFGVKFISSPFSLEAFYLLNEIGVDYIKIPSGEMNNIPMLEEIAKANIPTILSSGMSSINELDITISLFKEYHDKFMIMQCTSEYPCAIENVGLNVIKLFNERYNIPVGFSDHTIGFAAPFAAATLGATVIEKHFTFSKYMYGSDAKNSMEPDDFKILTKGLFDIWDMLNNPVDKFDNSPFLDMKLIFEKSIVAKQDLNKGTILSIKDLDFKKPGDGIKAFEYKKIIGKELLVNLKKDDKITLNILA
jgi:N-acetylneuraminate synthase